MSSARQLQDTMNWARPFLANMPQNISTGSEPALTNANHVIQKILGPPFIWPWNRGVYTGFSISQDTQDTVAAISDFGFLEMASLDGASDGSGGKLQLADDLASASLTDGSQKQRPARIMLLLDDNAGNYTFRTAPVADAAYSGKIIYQKKPVLFTGFGGFWSPIPDEMQYIYDAGFLALSLIFEKDLESVSYFSQQFIGGLLGRAQGLTEMQKNIFVTDWMMLTRQAQVMDLQTRSGRGALGV